MPTNINYQGLGDLAGQDAVRGVYDPYGNLYVLLPSLVANDLTITTPSFGNKIFKVNSNGYGYQWRVPTGNINFVEARNKQFFVSNDSDIILGSSNGFNALATNSSYLFFCDGTSLKAFDYTTGSQVGNMDSARRFRPLWQGGIAADECNNVYVGGRGSIRAFHFDGTNFIHKPDIPLGAGFIDTPIFDVRYNPSNNLLYVTGYGIIGTYNAYLSDSCDNWKAFNVNTVNHCQSAEVFLTTPRGLKASYSYTWLDTAGNILGQKLNTTDTFSVLNNIPTQGFYTIDIKINHNCLKKSFVRTIWVGSNVQLSLHDTTICPGQPVKLRAYSSAPGGTYTWQPTASIADSAIYSFANSTMVYVNYSVSGCGTAKDSAYISVQATPVLNVTHQGICRGDRIMIRAIPSVPGGSYVWSPSGDTTASFISAPDTDTSYIVTYSANGCNVVRDTATIVVHTLPSVAIVSTSTSKCFNPNGTALAIGSGGQPPYSFVWSNGVQVNPNTSLVAGLFTVTVMDANTCKGTDTFSIYNESITDSFVIKADSVSCYGSPTADGVIHISAIDTSRSPFLYTLNGQSIYDTATFRGLRAGDYQVMVRNKWGCDTTLSINVPEPAPAHLIVMPADTIITEGSPIKLNCYFSGYAMSSINSYSWQPLSGLGCTICPDPLIYTYDTLNVYTLTVNYNKGCLVSASATIIVVGDIAVAIPNAFTPNGDGINDDYHILTHGVADFSMRIYNRHDRLVYATDDITKGWDGNCLGDPQPNEIYVVFLTIHFVNNRTLHKEVTIELIR